jgi:hypothetical protein
MEACITIAVHIVHVTMMTFSNPTIESIGSRGIDRRHSRQTTSIKAEAHGFGFDERG